MHKTTEVAAISRTPDQARGNLRKYVAVVVAGVAVLQLLWIVVVPPFRGIDEVDHAYRASGVAAGQWRATQTPVDGRGLLVVAERSLVEQAHDQCASLSYTRPDNCSPAGDAGDGFVLVASGAGGYNPAFYAVVGTVAKPFSGAVALYVMRVTSALLCLVFIGLAAWSAGVRPGAKWSRVCVVVAMTPVMLYSTALPAPNGLEMAAALAFWASLLALGDASVVGRRERGVLLVAIASASVLMVDRLLGPLFALLALTTVWILRPALVRHVVTNHRRTFAFGSALVFMCVAWAVTWYLLHSTVRITPEKQGGEWRWTTLVLWPLQSIAAFPFRDQPGHLIVYPVMLAIFGALLWSALRIGARRDRLVLGLTLMVGIGLPLVLTALTYDGRGTMWQGRYGLPFTIGTVLVAGTILDARGYKTRWRSGLLLVGALFMAIASAACFVKVVGQERARDVSISDPSWHAPGLVVLVMGSLAAWALLHRAVSGTRL